MPRPKRKPPENIRSKLLGYLTDIYKLLTRLKRARRREEAGVETPQGLIQHVKVMDQITAELEALLPTAPKHEQIGLEVEKWARTLAAFQRHRQFNQNALTTIRDTIQASIEHANMLENQDRKNVFDEWIDRILDASEGYRKAHAFTRGTPKAPPYRHRSGSRINVSATHMK